MRGPRINILVVDDDVQCLAALTEVLVAEGHGITTATRGFEAVEIARAYRSSNVPLELSILDFHVPDRTGLETYACLTREIPRLGAIFMTADPTLQIEAQIRAAGGFALLHKPLDVSRLRRLVWSYLECAGRPERAAPMDGGE